MHATIFRNSVENSACMPQHVAWWLPWTHVRECNASISMLESICMTAVSLVVCRPQAAQVGWNLVQPLGQQRCLCSSRSFGRSSR